MLENETSQVFEEPSKKKFIKSTVALVALLLILLGVFYFVSRDKKVEPINSVQSAIDSGNWDVAISESQMILEKDPNNVSAMILLARTYLLKGGATYQEKEYANKAIELANKVLSIEPDNAEALRVKGFAYEISGEFDLAFENYFASLETDSDNPDTLSSLGHLYDLSGDIELAKRYYEQAYSIDAINPNTKLNLARVYFREEEYEKAENLLNNILDTENNIRLKSSAYQLMGIIKIRQGQHSSALSLFNQAVDTDPSYDAPYISRGTLVLATFIRQNLDSEETVVLPDEAYQPVITVMDDASKALGIYKSSSAYLLAGRAAMVLGDPESAKALFQKGLDVVDTDINLMENERESARNELQENLDLFSN